jgi:hypothetical protein
MAENSESREAVVITIVVDTITAKSSSFASFSKLSGSYLFVRMVL